MAEEEPKTAEEKTVDETAKAAGETTKVEAEETAEQADAKPAVKSESEQRAEVMPTAGRWDRFNLKKLTAAYWTKKYLTIPATVLVLLLLVLAIPFTRYNTLGLVLRKAVTVTVLDSKTNTPVSAARINVGGKMLTTDAAGKVTAKVKVGTADLQVTKQYYQPQSQGVTVKLSGNTYKVPLVAIGRQVPVMVTNKINGEPVANVAVKILNTEAKTDNHGRAIIVLPTAAATQHAKLSLTGYNDSNVTVQVTDKVVSANSFAIVPAGKLYFLSNQSGKIDVVKTNLDGSDRQTVLAGTGNEQPYSTSLLASRDWKYLALLAKRDGDNASVYLIDTSNDKLTTMDEGNASFQLVGWSNDTFVYQVNRNGVQSWQPNAQALKSYNAATGKLTVLDQTAGDGTGSYDYAYQQFSGVYLVSDQVVYTKNWYASTYPNLLSGKSVDLVSAKADGTGKKIVKSYPVPDGQQYAYAVYLSLYEPAGIYIRSSDSAGKSIYSEYEDGKVTADDGMTDTKFYDQSYPTYLQSPSGNQTFWSDQRDGKNVLFIGDDDAKNQKQIASLSEYNTYGWFTDNYLLVSKDSSELYIMSTKGSNKPLKITDYYKPPINYRGYGGGYGGL